MTQIGKILPSAFNFEAIRERNSEIVVRCSEHGEFCRGDLLQYGLQHAECPKCREARHELVRQEQRLKSAEHFFGTSSGVPPRFQTASFTGYQASSEQAQKILATLREYAARFEQHGKTGLSLILCGKTGTGKTHLSCAILRALAFEHGICGKYSTAYRAVQEIRASYKSSDVTELQVLKEFIRPDLLVLDEIGVQYGTDSEQLLLFSMLNGRYEELKPTIVISNLSLEEVTQYLGDRVYDRLRENGGSILVFDWESWRTKGSKK